jgi:putative ABC transport system permease protein
MDALRAASARHLLRHPLQLALAVGGLALGVATVTAVDLATASAQRAFGLSLDAVQGTATHEIVGGPAGIDEALYARLRTAGGPLRFAPLVEGYIALGGRAFQLVGLDPFADPGFRDDGGLAGAAGAGDGAQGIGQLTDWLLRPGAAALSARSAAQLGLESGAGFELGISGRAHSAWLARVIDAARPGTEALLLADIAQAQEWLGLQGRLTRIHVRAPEDPAGRAAIEALRARLPPGVSLVETRRRAEQSLDMTAAFTANLEAMGLLALLVAVFLIYSAISFAVVQRRTTLATLRALGATRGALLRLVLGEAALLGIAGSALGLALGSGIGRELIRLVTRTINDLYFVVAVNEVPLPAGSIARALITGLGAALLAAALPALEVARSTPQLGLRRSALESRARRVARWLVPASAAFAAAAAALVLGTRRSLLAGLVALFLLLLAAALLTPAALRALAALAARALSGSSPVARLAVSDVAASLSRTGIAAAALGMAVAAMLSVGVMVGSFRESLRDWLDTTLRADVYVSAPGTGFARPERRLEPQVVAALLADPAVVDHSAARRVQVESARGPIQLDAFEPAREARAGFELVSGDPRAAWDAVARGALLISEPLAWRLELEPGDALELVTTSGPAAFPIAGVYREYGNDRGSALMDRAIYAQRFRDAGVTSLALYLAPGASADALIPRLHAAAGARQAILARSNAGIRTLSLAIFERTFAITRVLQWLAAGVAALGLLSALLAWELERARELAILRALGLTPAGAALMLELQTAFMGFAAWLAALPAGLGAALLLIHVVNRRAFGWRIDAHVEPGQLGAALGLALVSALAAGLYPAWRAARAPLAQAVREE